MRSKPIIGIVAKNDIQEENYEVFCCMESIRKAIVRFGGIPLMILPTQDVNYEKLSTKDSIDIDDDSKEDMYSIVDMCDGILFPGTYKLFGYDLCIYQYALKKDIPILGICGGMQLMGLADYNTLDSKDILLKNETVINHFQKGVEYVHKVKVLKDTLLYKILEKEEIKVNSRHNYHINKVNNLTISASSEDDLIEAVEVKDKKFALGLEWHPENMIDYDLDACKIFEYFILSCKK